MAQGKATVWQPHVRRYQGPLALEQRRSHEGNTNYYDQKQRIETRLRFVFRSCYQSLQQQTAVARRPSLCAANRASPPLCATHQTRTWSYFRACHCSRRAHKKQSTYLLLTLRRRQQAQLRRQRAQLRRQRAHLRRQRAHDRRQR
jgi:hypothetical protein